MSDKRDPTVPGRGSNDTDGELQSTPHGQKELPAAAQRALAEAEARRRAADAQTKPNTAEVGGRDGPDPVRYGDWEKGGIISDF